jgi:hypothetical protein
MKFFYLILFFLAGCNTTMIDAVNYDDFRRQSLLKGFYFSAEAKSDNIKHLNDRGGYGSGVIQLRANQIALQSCTKAGFSDCIITKENNNNVRLTQWQQAEAKALELQNTELIKALELKNAEIKALELKNAEAKVLESKNINLSNDKSSEIKKGLKNNWKLISKTESDSTAFYLDPTSIVTDKYYKYYWQLSDYLISKDNVKSVITYNKVDCGNFKSQILKMTLYDGYQGKGKVLREHDLKSEWTIGEAKSAGEKVLISVCKS